MPSTTMKVRILRATRRFIINKCCITLDKRLARYIQVGIRTFHIGTYKHPWAVQGVRDYSLRLKYI